MNHAIATTTITVSILLLAGCANPSVGNTAPQFSLTDSAGQQVTLDSFAGKPMVILFGSVKGCDTCIVESKNVLKPLHGQVGDRVGFLTVSILPAYESDRDLNDFKREYGLAWNHARDTDGVARAYGITQLSTVVVLDADHNIVHSSIEPSQATLRSALGM